LSASPATAPLLACRAIHVWRGERHVLRGVDCELRRGEFLKLVGPNGSGKTTLLRVLCGLLPMESGEVYFEGRSIQRCRDAFHAALGYLGHTHALKADLSATENLQFLAGLRRTPQAGTIAAALARVGLAGAASQPMRSLSAGQRRRLALARLLLADAPIWVMDEPVTNLDTAGIGLVQDMITEQVLGGGCVIAAVHQPLLDGAAFQRRLELA
jgi:heme exporter protein A